MGLIDMQEAGMMASLRHPNVVMYLGVCMDPPCVITEYCARGSLNDVLKRARYVPALAMQLDWPRRSDAHPPPPFLLSLPLFQGSGIC